MEEEDEYSSEEGDAPLEPTMKGELTRHEDRLWWIGMWGTSEAAFASDDGKTSKFKYGGPAAESDDALRSPPAGAWNGYFFMADEKIREKGVQLSFEKTDDDDVLVITGSGTNDFGDFNLHGTYKVDARKLEVVKTYAGPVAGEDDDELDEDAIDDDYGDELKGLREEQDMPIEELAKRYGRYAGGDDDDEDEEDEEEVDEEEVDEEVEDAPPPPPKKKSRK